MSKEKSGTATVHKRFRRGGPGGKIVDLSLDGTTWTCTDYETGQEICKVHIYDGELFNFSFLDQFFV